VTDIKKTKPLFRNELYLAYSLVFAAIAFLLFYPDFALAQDLGDLTTKSNSAVSWIKTAVHAILVVSVIGSGVLAAFGRMSWATVGQVIIGAVVAGLATEVVDALYGTGG
jgi:type IV secretory pathway VirB2 component (pilin)